MNTHNICFMEKYRKLSSNYQQTPTLSVALVQVNDRCNIGVYCSDQD